VHEHGYDAVFHPRMCKPGCHRFPGGSQYCSHCGITRTDLVASFPRN
jgi:hypothetical protein